MSPSALCSTLLSCRMALIRQPWTAPTKEPPEYQPQPQKLPIPRFVWNGTRWAELSLAKWRMAGLPARGAKPNSQFHCSSRKISLNSLPPCLPQVGRAGSPISVGPACALRRAKRLGVRQPAGALKNDNPALKLASKQCAPDLINTFVHLPPKLC